MLLELKTFVRQAHCDELGCNMHPSMVQLGWCSALTRQTVQCMPRCDMSSCIAARRGSASGKRAQAGAGASGSARKWGTGAKRGAGALEDGDVVPPKWETGAKRGAGALEDGDVVPPKWETGASGSKWGTGAKRERAHSKTGM